MAVTITVSSYVVEADGVVGRFVRHAFKLQNYTTTQLHVVISQKKPIVIFAFLIPAECN